MQTVLAAPGGHPGKLLGRDGRKSLRAAGPGNGPAGMEDDHDIAITAKQGPDTVDLGVRSVGRQVKTVEAATFGKLLAKTGALGRYRIESNICDFRTRGEGHPPAEIQRPAQFAANHRHRAVADFLDQRLRLRPPRPGHQSGCIKRTVRTGRIDIRRIVVGQHTGALLQQKRTAHAGIQVGLIDLAAFQGGAKVVERLLCIFRHQHNVDAGLVGLDRRIGVALGHAFHLKRVGDNHAVEAQLIPKQPGNDRIGNGRRSAGWIEGRHAQVADHHHCHARIDHCPERIEFQRVQPRPVEGQHRQGLMGIHIRIAMTRKMLGRAPDLRALHAPHKSNTQVGHFLSGLAHRAGLDHGVLWIVVDIDHRREIHKDLDLAEFLPDGTASRLGERLVVERAQLHGPRKSRILIVAHRSTPFPVDRDHQRNLGSALEVIDQPHIVDQFVIHYNDSTESFPDQALLLCLQLRRLLRIDSHIDELRDFLAGSHRSDDRIDVPCKQIARQEGQQQQGKNKLFHKPTGVFKRLKTVINVFMRIFVQFDNKDTIKSIVYEAILQPLSCPQPAGAGLILFVQYSNPK